VLLGVDVGGTFTDAVLFDGEELHTAKLPTTPEDQSLGVIGAIEEVLRRAGAEPAAVESFAHGMTVGTNALLEERGARTALIATEGFADLLEIGRQERPELYRLCAAKPAPLVDPELRDDPYPLAAAIATCALARAESRGGHLRADFPEIDPGLDGVHIVRAADGTTRREQWR
jgi:hypothetical protein